MPNALKWEAAPTARVLIDLGTTLADTNISAAGSELDNSVNLDRWGWLELTTSDQTALFDTTSPNAVAPVVEIYRTLAPDGTNYEDAPNTTDISEQRGKFVIAIPIQKDTAMVGAVVGPIFLPPVKQKYYAYVRTGAGTMTAEWELNLYTVNEELQ